VVRALVLSIAAAVAGAACGSCSKAATPEEAPSVTPPPTDPPPRADTRPRVFVGDAAVRVEVVATEPTIRKGLMYRQHLPPDDGMLFLMGEEDDHHFWMKNTLIPLDILFITRDMKVAGILYDMKPRDTTSKGVGEPSLYVLEVNAGWAKANGVAAGTPVRFEGVPLDRAPAQGSR
jgi:uncharacterized membrane protein (UPF0127 family)